ncbi:hypothetical protein CBX57_018275 [Salmonella enterica]|nr:hypothetical protein [Salmonella enterica]
MFAESMAICKKIFVCGLIIISLLFITHNGWADSSNIEIMREYEKEGKYSVRNLVKNKGIASDLAEIYVSHRYGKQASEEEKPYKITELPTSWLVEGTIGSDKIAGGVFIIEINKNDGRILNFGHGR